MGRYRYDERKSTGKTSGIEKLTQTAREKEVREAQATLNRVRERGETVERAKQEKRAEAWHSDPRRRESHDSQIRAMSRDPRLPKGLRDPRD